MATLTVPMAKLQLEFEDTNGQKFTETPFYIDANIIGNANFPTGNTSGSYQSHTPQQVYDKINTCISQIASLSTGTLKSSKLIYEVEVN